MIWRWLKSAFSWKRKLELNAQSHLNGVHHLNDRLGVAPSSASQNASTVILVQNEKSFTEWRKSDPQRTETCETALNIDSLDEENNEDGQTTPENITLAKDSSHLGYCTWDTDSGSGFSNGSTADTSSIKDKDRERKSS